ncbi:serine/threonine-protein kinase [Streptomyces sp. ISL-10]|uniref:serine/threonine-protein kinase n=1 Tax=Streptomyces sp. ISL-10 TaxID=2819172 RepID=UPI001BEC04D3|nr:serine/threonine-protein kinase [Streptomyces sp. ISL-10]MBT2370077.1 serine/threonine-protein kinase [Streptomyces sp. ISL-10]
MKPLGPGDPLRLGPYRLLGVLGEGGMGKVYFGQDSFGRKAAVKVLRPELAHDQNLGQRFVREAQMAQSVTSTGVARVLGAHTDGGRPWIATEFLTGPTLDNAVRAHGPLDEPTLRVLASSLARTLADIHAAGLIHRDLKPANIVLTSAGPRVIDFGIARPEHGLTLTTTGQIPVTPGFGAPEQVLGQRVGPAADVFSLGAVLIYAATGNQAFTGTHVAAVQYEVVHGAPRMDQIPAHLAPLIGPCLAKDPAHRPTPGQLAAAFAPARGAERVWRQGPLASDIKEQERTIHRLTTVVASSASGGVSRRRLLTSLGVGGAVLAAGAGATAWWLGSRGDSGPYALPSAADTPMADPVAATAGKPKPLWGPVQLLDKTGGGLVPVRDVVIAVGAAEGGLTAHSVVDGKRRWHARGVDADAGIVTLSDALVAAVDKKGDVVTFVASSGEDRWSVPASAKYVLAADDSAVYIVTKDDELRSISRSDGSIRWTVALENRLEAETRPRSVAGGGRLVVATSKGRIRAVDTTDGHQVWSNDDQSSIAGNVSLYPALHKDMVLIDGATLTARSLSDGTERWTKSITLGGDLQPSGPPLVQNGLVYSAQVSYVLALNATDGTEVWRSPAGYFMNSPVAVQGDAVCAISSTAGDGDGWALHAMSRSDNKHVWNQPLPNDGSTYWLAGDGNRLFLRAGAEVVALPVFE